MLVAIKHLAPAPLRRGHRLHRRIMANQPRSPRRRAPGIVALRQGGVFIQTLDKFVQRPRILRGGGHIGLRCWPIITLCADTVNTLCKYILFHRKKPALMGRVLAMQKNRRREFMAENQLPLYTVEFRRWISPERSARARSCLTSERVRPLCAPDIAA